MKTVAILLVLAFLYYIKNKNDGNNGPGNDMSDFNGGAPAL